MSTSTAPNVVFILGAPRSGTTMLERMLSAHPSILGGPESHLLTPLAYLGPWARVDAAPYDHIVASIGQKAFIDRLPRGEADYWEACRAYGDMLYSRLLADGAHKIYVDKTPEYVTIWPFLSRVYPDASYVVLTRHPAAVFTSFASSFFDDNLRIAHAHDPLLERYVPAIASFLRQMVIPYIHVRYEDLVTKPEEQMRHILEHLGLNYIPEVLDYGIHSSSMNGLGDPLGVNRHRGPSTSSLNSWAERLVTDADGLNFVKAMVQKLDPNDLYQLGYPAESFWDPLTALSTNTLPVRRNRLNFYLLERKITVHGRALVQRHSRLRHLIQRLRLACDVFLRQY